MTNLTPNPGWDDVPQLEANTKALGGPGAPMNLQAQALLNRTEALNPDNQTAPASLDGTESWSVRKSGAWARLSLSAILTWLGATYANLSGATLTGAYIFGLTAGDQGKLDTNGHIGLGGKSPATNGYVYIGKGSGSLTDNGVMGIKVKLDTTASATRDGAQSNINIISGSANGQARGFVSRVDLNDATSTGNVVGLWGDVLANANSTRSLWGANIYTQLGTSGGGLATYTGAAVGAEIALSSYVGNVNSGGILHLVSNGGVGSQIRFGILIGATNNAVQHAIMVPSNGGQAPDKNLVYYGPLDSGNNPTGTPVFVVDALGNITATNVALTPPASVTPVQNGSMSFQLTNDTTLTVKVKGSDGVMRSVNLTLA